MKNKNIYEIRPIRTGNKPFPRMIGVTASLREAEFKEIMQNTITPLHRIAQNQGFGLWTV